MTPTLCNSSYTLEVWTWHHILLLLFSAVRRLTITFLYNIISGIHQVRLYIILLRWTTKCSTHFGKADNTLGGVSVVYYYYYYYAYPLYDKQHYILSYLNKWTGSKASVKPNRALYYLIFYYIYVCGALTNVRTNVPNARRNIKNTNEISFISGLITKYYTG